MRSGDRLTRASGSTVRAGSVSDGRPLRLAPELRLAVRRPDARHGPWTSLTLPALLARGAWLLSRTNSATSKSASAGKSGIQTRSASEGKSNPRLRFGFVSSSRRVPGVLPQPQLLRTMPDLPGLRGYNSRGCRLLRKCLCGRCVPAGHRHSIEMTAWSSANFR